MFNRHNTHFKAPPPAIASYPRSPSPPTSYIEPLSPTAIRPRPIEPSFYYPAVSHGQSWKAAQPEGREPNVRKRGHHRVSSSIDTLADAALSLGTGNHAFAVYPGYGYAATDSPHKRARSEAYPTHFSVGQARPYTSHDPWSYANQNAYETRVEDAALLLNFSSTGGKSTPQHAYVESYQQPMFRPHANSMPSQPMPPLYHDYRSQRPPLPSPQRTSESKGPTPEALSDRAYDTKHSSVQPHQMHTPPEELEHFIQRKGKKDAAMTVPPKKRGWPKGKPRGPAVKKEPKLPVEKPVTKRAATRKRKPGKKGAVPEIELRRRASFSDVQVHIAPVLESRSRSVPRDVQMLIRGPVKARRMAKKKDVTICGGCHSQRESAAIGELDEWISCNGCKQWYHLDCAGFKRAVEVRDVDKYFCPPCEPAHGKTTYVRKSTRAHASVDYAELQKGVLRTGEESTEHHYIQPIKDGSFTFDPESFPRIRPELLTRDFLERSGAFVEPIVIPGEWNKRPWGVAPPPSDDQDMLDEEVDSHDEPLDPDFEYDTALDEGQDQLDMIMPKGLTVRKVCQLVGPETPLDVIDVKTQNSGAKWNLARWADYYESTADDKPVRNVISLEVSQTKLGRLLRRPKVVRDIDLQDRVWPQEETERGKWPKVQYYCLMSIADSYTDFHIDFGGSSVYYHLIKGKKTFFFIPPKPKHLKAYEEWNDNPQQNFTFLPDITKECYRVDLSEGDTMLIPSGWIHAVWTPETSLVIGGNFLTHMNFKNQFKVAEIEKNNETPLKFRYPFFQRLMWYTALHYMQEDPLPSGIRELFLAGKQYDRAQPIWQDFDEEHADRPSDYNARYYGQSELDGLPELSTFIFRTVMMTLGRVEGITADRMKRVHASIPKGHGEPLEIAKAFAYWVAWKRGNEVPPAWAHPDAPLPEMEEAVVKKLSARAIKELERREAVAKSSNEKVSKRAKKDQDRHPIKRESQDQRPEQYSTAHHDDVQLHAQEVIAGGDQYLYQPQHQQYPAHDQHRQYHAYQPPTQPMPPSQHDTHHMPPMLKSPIQLASSSNLALVSEPPADATTHLHASDATSSNFFIDNAKAAHTTTTSSYSSASSPPMFVHTSLHQDSMFAPSYDASSAPTMMMSAFHGQHISTPKTSVLGPKRVACDACRRRRIRCKHKDFVVQAIPEMSLQALSGLGGNGASGDDFQSSLEAGAEEQIAYDVNADGLSTPNASLDVGSRPGSIPGTNAYIDANIPMTLNGVALFGDPKRGRSKACLECRKSKRRCIHDEQGNVDPIKAAETPVPRTSTLDKKRESEEPPTNESKKAKINNVGTLGVLKPMIKMASPVSDWSSASPHSDMMLHTPIDGSTPNSHASLPIDPSLTNNFADDVFHYHYAHAINRPPMVSLPSLEEIATEVLDFEGGAGNAGDEMDLAAIAQFNQSTNIQLESPVPAEPETTQTIAEEIAEMPAEVTAETTVAEPAADVTPTAEPAQATIETTRETSESTTIQRQDSVATIPMYKPPASKSPELRRAQLEPRSAKKAAASPRVHTRNASRTSIAHLARESMGDALAV